MVGVNFRGGGLVVDFFDWSWSYLEELASHIAALRFCAKESGLRACDEVAVSSVLTSEMLRQLTVIYSRVQIILKAVCLLVSSPTKKKKLRGIISKTSKVRYLH